MHPDIDRGLLVEPASEQRVSESGTEEQVGIE